MWKTGITCIFIFKEEKEMNDNRIREIINEELTKSEVENIASRRANSIITSNDFKRKVKEITADVIEDFMKVMWQRSGTWKGSVR